jgi:glucarate dehydratase
VRDSADYFYYLARGTEEGLIQQCRDGVQRGYHVFYLKVGLDIDTEYKMVRVVRQAIGSERRLRLDANGAWTVNQALRNLDLLDEFQIDFVEQPVSQDPVTNMQEVRARSRVAVCANEGMWTAEDAYQQITKRTADVYCFSSYWVGSLAQFQRLCRVAAMEGLQICKHTHGEFGIAAAAAHHILLTLPNVVAGNQQTAQMMCDDVLKHPLPIASGPKWGVPEKPGLGIDVDEEKVRRYHESYQSSGQFVPYDPALI